MILTVSRGELGACWKDTVRAISFGSLAVHQAIGMDTGWVITHVKSGWRFCKPFASKKEAVRIAKILSRDPVWEHTQERLEGEYKETCKQLILAAKGEANP